MRLTRRDALASLAGAGIIGGGSAATLARDRVESDEESGPLIDADTRAVLVATTEVLYPSAVEGVESFVGTYAARKAEARPDYREGVADATDSLAEYAGVWEGTPFVELSVAGREDLLRRMGVHTADPVRDGTDPERVRFFVVNELLFALYTSPTGGELVGIENPQGHPGGTTSYTQGPGEPR
jgi:hypothetical protein